jgi:hypothetical protein
VRTEATRAEGTIETTTTGETAETRANVGTTTEEIDAMTEITIELTGETTSEIIVLPDNTKRSVRRTESAGLLFSGTSSLISVPERTGSTSTSR